MIAPLIVLGVLLVLLALSVSRSARRERERREEEQRRREALSRGGDEACEFSPFAGMPFGGLFDALLTGPGTWSRSLEYDPQSGRWVETSDREEPERGEPEVARGPTRNGEPARPAPPP